ncbi:mucin-4 isoform X1 [Bactrocera dorsalis]|uniref:Mucin-4 isoform X1 n=1 Tax=Bactrocera dorsalis TaxID=27457 RepID=A0A8N4L3I4_BACDO|nr:mucin-4 isoform X1 [Bactrocera dorsalis]XP_011202346.2 mucin-4 isoform X1 [Bactrocera dorsalis]XP_011202347.2 mucin-4 isoform X1 [Bactrocera dorsalis]XP_011202351.2 mucin-4 isoform X1 [Bactrocera dorsalis]XP_029405735.2 mucin-4 isoform X1 [Bactrocera dorsalis]
MFSFHKPRVYRSAEGCCICRAKSSSSRFTDSRKYEQDSMKCFNLKYPRHGEICNACVLLVKRFKRLPGGSTRHWGHVVDARAGPGTKSISKHKKSRDDRETTAHSASSNNTNSRRASNSKSLIPEKFSKIFKKSKKSKLGAGACSERKADECRRSVSELKTWKDQHLFSATLDSMDSDYEDIGEGGDVYDSKRGNVNVNNSTVQFQTQTRASANRASRRATNISNVSNNNCKSPLKTGSKRRKCMPPIRNRSTLKLVNDKTQFFDETEWQERKTCCGMMYVCPSLAGTILLDIEKFEVCTEHKRSQILHTETKSSTNEELSSTLQKTIIATMPAVVQLSAPSVASVCPPPLPNPVNAMKTNHTPVLKKHHLFFKRQSESFPQVDLAVNNNIINSSNKTESLAVSTNTPVIIKSSTNIANHSGSTPHSSAISIGSNSNIVVSTPLSLAINTTNVSAISSISPSNATSASAQMPRHSTAKVTTISPPLPTTNIIGSNRLLHKIKAGKIFKHSLEKIGVTSTAAPVSSATVERIKAGDFQDIKPVMRNVTKSYVVSKPITGGSNQQSTQYYPVGSSPTSTCSNSSAASSSLSSTAPKFSDNSSDSGFDENLQDRKSASPLQEDTEKKLAARAAIGNVHTMFLASGVQIHGQPQNLMLTGNEVAAKLLQNRKQHLAMMANSSAGAMQQHFQQQQSATNVSRIGSATPSLKISPVTPATISTISVGNSVANNSHSKATSATITTSRAIYNNNTIQHENGVTTIVPASSLAASTQTAAMNALAPSTVTITPAPTHQLGNTASSTSLGLTKKLTTSGVGVNLIATGGSNQSNILHTVTNAASHLINHGNSTLLHQQAHHLQQQQPLQHHSTASNLNQKIILLKTSGPTKYNNLANISSSSLNSVKLPNGTTPIAASPVNTAGVCKN